MLRTLVRALTKYQYEDDDLLTDERTLRRVDGRRY